MTTRQKAETTPAKTADASGLRTSLDCQYGDIGISAVAAALPYVGETKTRGKREASGRSIDPRKRSVLAV